MNKHYKLGIILAGVAVAFVVLFVFVNRMSSSDAIVTPFWTTLGNDTREVWIRQGKTITVPIELHYSKNLKTLLGIQFEEPEAEQGGLYNPPDGLIILFDVDGAYFEVDNGRIVDVITHRNVTLSEPNEIEQRMEGNIIVAKVGTITVSVTDAVPTGNYYFGIGTANADVNAVYGGNSQRLTIRVIE